MLPRHQAAVAAVSVGLSHAPAPTSTLQDSKVLLFAWLATRWDAFSRCRMSGLLGGHMLAVFVWRKLLQRSKKAVQPIKTIGLYPLKWTSPRTYPARIWEYLHQIHKNWPFKSRNCTHFGDNNGRDTDSRHSPKITVQGENHGNHGDREFVIYIHP